MVSTASIISFIVSIAICFALLFGFMIWLGGKKRRAIVPVLVGMGVFFVFQLLTRVPLLSYVLPNMSWYMDMAASQPWLYGLFLGLTAGLFEEIGRYVGFRVLLKNNRRWIDGFAFGVGHGGFEAVSLVGLANINNLILSLSINNGSFSQIAANLPAETAAKLQEQLIALQPFEIILGGAERIFAFTIQIALSLLVLYAVRRRKVVWLGLAVLLHMLIDAPIVILQRVYNFNALQLELFVFALAVCALIFILFSRRLFHDLSENESTPPDIVKP